CLYSELMLANLAFEMTLCSFDILGDLFVEGPSESLRFRQVRSDLRIVEIEGIGEDEHVGVVVDAVSRGAIHHAVLAQETRRAVVVNHELHWLIEPAV